MCHRRLARARADPHPWHLNFPSHEVFRFLASRVPDCGGRDVNPNLVEYLERQEHHFGPDHVATFRAASRRLTGDRVLYRAFCIGLVVAGLAWSVIGFSGMAETGWGMGGILSIVTGALRTRSASPRRSGQGRTSRTGKTRAS